MKASVPVKTSTGIIILLIIFGFLIFPTLPTILAAILLWSVVDNILDSSERFKNKNDYLSKLKIILPSSVAICSIVGLLIAYIKFFGSAQGPIIGILFVGPAGALFGFILFLVLALMLKPKD